MDLIANRTAVVGIIGLGYVGLPLVIESARAGFRVLGFDIDERKVKSLVSGGSYIRHLPAEMTHPLIEKGQFTPTTDFDRLAEADVILITVPTPLGRNREPDLSYVVKTAEDIAKRLRKGQLICLESTTYPGTTDEELLPRFEAMGLKVGVDYFLAYSPEREDPGTGKFETRRIPKVAGGTTADCLNAAVAFYGALFEKVVPVSSTRVAEMTKLLENIYRAVNIALVNELKLVAEDLNFDIWEVIDAASTKPFGFMPFYPGPGLGGHCIPIDPFYLTWKAREVEVSTRFIELAGEINTYMPHYVVQKLVDALSDRGRAARGAKVLLLGVAYKADVDDVRESPAIKIVELLEKRGMEVQYHDPYVPEFHRGRKGDLGGRHSLPLTAGNLRASDAVLIVTGHKSVDYDLVVKEAPLIIDTRNATKDVKVGREKIVRA